MENTIRLEAIIKHIEKLEQDGKLSLKDFEEIKKTHNVPMYNIMCISKNRDKLKKQ